MTLIPIGQFARASRLSIKSLRNYDQSGLLPAAFVDPESGYRYYRLEQLARADTIRSLRIVDMPLPRIAEILEVDEPEELLTSHLAALELQRDELNRKAEQLRRQINRREFTMSNTVTIKTSNASAAIGYRIATTTAEMEKDIPAGFEKAMARITEAGLQPVGAPFTLYHEAPDGDSFGDIAMCVPVDTTEPVSEDTQLFTFDEGAAASIIHRGSYWNMAETYATVHAWLQERGHHITGPTREIYLNSPEEVPEAELLTELLFPIDAEETN